MLEVLCLSARFALCGGLVLNIHNLEVFVNTETMYTFSTSRSVTVFQFYFYAILVSRCLFFHV
jgi:hypothetical protein